jgi:putative YhdH/YhfP family quinone oxidoreductase
MQAAKTFRALWVEENPAETFTRRIVERSTADLPEGQVLVRVQYSSLNYKDALSASGNRGVTRRYPHTPGIDLAGVVEESSSADFSPGDTVISAAAGDIGVNMPGGFGQYVRAQADWLVKLPAGLSLKEAMIYGTAGFTAGMCVDRLEREGVTPQSGSILVTGASGGVGSIATSILARGGYRVTAVTGKSDEMYRLREMGAAEVLNREEFTEGSSRGALLHARWAGVVDSVGGAYLSTAIRGAKPGGVVTACGNAASPELSLTVFPFILRGVTLAGIDATRPTRAERERLWQRLAGPWKLPHLDRLAREVPLEDLESEIQATLRGSRRDRVVVRLEDR